MGWGGVRGERIWKDTYGRASKSSRTWGAGLATVALKGGGKRNSDHRIGYGGAVDGHRRGGGHLREHHGHRWALQGRGGQLHPDGGEEGGREGNGVRAAMWGWWGARGGDASP